MKPFPEMYELIEVFESEPVVSDEDIPYFYTCIKFSLVRCSDTLECEIEPSHNTMRMRWSQGARQLVYLNLQSVSGIEIEKRSNKERLYIYFLDEVDSKKLIIQLNPEISIFWATNTC